MPELPEVETVCRGIAPHITDKQIVDVNVRNPHLRIPLPQDFAARITGLTVKTVSRRAKYICIHCDKDTSLIIHLGMSGSLTILTNPPSAHNKHDHVIIQLSHETYLVYRDPRRFGFMAVKPTDMLPHFPSFTRLGPEPLDKEWTGEELYNAVHHKNTAIKIAIMDQQSVVGVGNIYACEALFLAGIHPARPASGITKPETTRLAQAIKRVLSDAIASGGSTLRDYVRSSGEAGYFQHHFNVYGKKGQLCPNCNTPIAIIRQSGRSTFFCTHCQH